MRYIRYDNFQTKLDRQTLPMTTPEGTQVPMAAVIFAYVERDNAVVHEFAFPEERFKEMYKALFAPKVTPASVADMARLPKMPGG